MPLYQYKCVACGLVTERFRYLADREYVIWCKCGDDAIRVITPPHLHGSPNMPNG